MLPVIVTALLAALGAAFVLQGREARGLLVILAVLATAALGAGLYGRWQWVAFFLAMIAIDLTGLAFARRERR